MAECQNFFDDTSQSGCRSSSSTEWSSPAAAAITSIANDECDDHRLELCLGPSVNANKRKQHEMVRPIPIYPSLDKQRSGNFTHGMENSPLFRGYSDVAMADKALFSKDSAFTTPLRISREQVWQTLEKTKDLLGQDTLISKASCDDAASSMWGRRSTSMQIITPSSEVSEVGVCHIRRTYSNGFPQDLLSRQSSFCQEDRVDGSPDSTSVLLNQQQEALEWRKKKEMQAQRRLEARTRRRLLIEGKQKRKARPNGGVCNKQEKVVLACTPSLDHNCSLEPQCKPHYELFSAKLGDDVRMKGKIQRNDVRSEEMVQALHRCMSGRVNLPCDVEDANSRGNYIEKMMHMECESTSSGSKHFKGDLSSVQNMIASCDLSAHGMLKGDNAFVQAGKDVDAGEGVKCPPSSCSETESSEIKRNNMPKEMDYSERDKSSQKSSSENHIHYGGFANAPHSNMRTSSGVESLQVMLSLPCSTQYATTASGRNDGLQTSHSVLSACKTLENSGNEDLNSFAIKKCVGAFSEGKWRIPDEKSTFSPIRRTISNTSEAVSEPQHSAKQLETHVSVSASQLKFATMVSDNAAAACFRNWTNEMGEKLSCANKLDPHKMHVKNQCDYYTEEERPIVGLTHPGDTRAEMSGLGICSVKVKQEEVTMEEGSFKNDSVSKNQNPSSSSIQCGVMNRQRSASISDLPWVTTTGRGPNGKTINGVMYISSGQCVRLVCRCHGKHMSPTEFVEHSGSTDLSNPLKNIVVNPFPMPNQVASMPV